ncbi:hypothetical protein SCB29_41315, partial [Paraburkholderia sp. SIMBA_055]
PALLGYPVRVGQRQQGAQPTRVVRVGDRRTDLSTQQAAVLAGQLASTLHPTLATTRSLALTADQRKPAVQVGTTATLNVP